MTSLWIPFILVASLLQVARNAMQRGLTAELGTVGATLIRFLFGFPFAVLFLLIAFAATGETMVLPSSAFWPWLLVGALTQIAATGLMLMAMNMGSFVVATAYIKTEPILAALFGFAFLADALSAWKIVAIVLATLGVVVTAIRPGGEKAFGDLKATSVGLASAATFAFSAVGFRGAILAVQGVSFVTVATFTLTMGLLLQTLVLLVYLLVFDRKTLAAILQLWRPSMLAGLCGALSSQFLFFGFALTTVANVRTLALIEVLYAQAVSHYTFKQKIAPREIAGVVLIVVGVGLLVAMQ